MATKQVVLWHGWYARATLKVSVK